MWTYQAPVADMLHVMTRVLGAPQSRAAMPAFADLDVDTAHEVVQQAARFATELQAGSDLGQLRTWAGLVAISPLRPGLAVAASPGALGPGIAGRRCAAVSGGLMHAAARHAA